MSLLVVGSVALDSIFTPFGETADALGGSAVYFSVAGSLLHPVQVVGVVGSDYPVDELEALARLATDATAPRLTKSSPNSTDRSHVATSSGFHECSPPA